MKFYGLFLVMICFFSINAGEIIIQNGLNGYEGCTDSYMTEAGEDDGSPHGLEPYLLLEGGS